MMKLVWLFSLIGLLLSVGWAYSDSSNSNHNLKIGAIFSLETVDAKVSHIGMQAAIDDINSDSTILGGRTLSLSVHDANRSGFLSVMGALQFMEKDYVAIIGPQTSKMAHVLAPLANQLHVPLLSFTALDPTLSPLQYPYFIQTAPNDLFQMAAIADMISYFGWTQVVAIFTDGDETRNGISVLGQKLNERRCKISYKAALPPDSKGDRKKVMMSELLKVKMRIGSRVIVVHATTVSGPMILKLAEELGMVRSGYVWFATSWLADVLDSSDHQGLGGGAHEIGSVQGVVTLRHHVPDSKRKRDFVSRWDKLMTHDTIIDSSNNNYSVGLNANGMYAYDTVWVIARALRAFLDEGKNITFSTLSSEAVVVGSLNLSIFDGGEDLLKLRLRSNLTGVTGQMSFSTEDPGNGYSMPINPSFDVLNVVGSQLRLVGYWSNYSGLSVDPPSQDYRIIAATSSQRLMHGGVVWPGGGRKVPRGWGFPHSGRKLRIGVPYRVSFRGFVSVDNRTGSNNVTGYSIDVFLAAAKLLPYPLPFEFVVFGDGRHNPSIDLLVDKVKDNELDALVGDIAIVTNRTKIVDFTLPFTESGLEVVAPVNKMSSSAWAFLKPFKASMWAVTAVFFFFLGSVTWILEHGANQEFRGTRTKQFVTVLWFSFSSMFFAHRVYPMSTLGRMVLVIWLFVVLIIQSSYKASLTSILTIQQLSSPIKGIDMLVTSNQRIGYQVGSFTGNYLNQELNVHRSRLVALDFEEDYVSALDNGTVAAVVDERPYVDMFVSRHCGFTIVGSEFTKNGWGFAFPRGSPLTVDMSNALLELSEKGELQKIKEEWKRRKRGHCSLSSGTTSSAEDRIHFSNFNDLFLFFGTACFIALLVYFCLRVCKFMRHEPAGQAPTSRFTRFRTFVCH